MNKAIASCEKALEKERQSFIRDFTQNSQGPDKLISAEERKELLDPEGCIEATLAEACRLIRLLEPDCLSVDDRDDANTFLRHVAGEE